MKLSKKYKKGKIEVPTLKNYIAHFHSAGYYSENCPGCHWEDSLKEKQIKV